ncbi:hypothetical protein SNEBB_003395 [Seison nebaliae]|nr:hypothetical protein SNEBB_003395 [Seison nebaliae]
MARKFFVGGNWKCNCSRAQLTSIIDTLKKAKLNDTTEIVISPPTCYLTKALEAAASSKINVSAQNCWKVNSGAFTGEVSAPMLKDIGVNYVILGHSERRSIFKESNELIGEKCKHAEEHGMNIILCCGEQLEERGKNQTEAVVFKQLGACLPNITKWEKVVIAYEPVWAIGTGKVASPDEAQAVHVSIRKWLGQKVNATVAQSTRIIYGGSVSGKNCTDLSKKEDIDGFLVGGASLKPEFVDIINSK